MINIFNKIIIINESYKFCNVLNVILKKSKITHKYCHALMLCIIAVISCKKEWNSKTTRLNITNRSLTSQALVLPRSALYATLIKHKNKITL